MTSTAITILQEEVKKLEEKIIPALQKLQNGEEQTNIHQQVNASIGFATRQLTNCVRHQVLSDFLYKVEERGMKVAVEFIRNELFLKTQNIHNSSSEITNLLKVAKIEALSYIAETVEKEFLELVKGVDR